MGGLGQQQHGTSKSTNIATVVKVRGDIHPSVSAVCGTLSFLMRDYIVITSSEDKTDKGETNISDNSSRCAKSTMSRTPLRGH